ncbi:deoxyribose-phosphate aldolase [Butyrivibrio sp. MC2013]|uniref:deoxyribose-phosphate aldolase n=1 Tax=Butyrivibrio sp. MC2013 TaxID=1280686 RepID=UPI000408758F|nr:deoxyribose-phosphate aldolase [Butyrivibrio sp. MC2013]
MDGTKILKAIDHTLLKADASWEGIKKLCDEAVKYKTASVCIPPCYIKKVHDCYKDDLTICTVIGFPLGYSVTQAKVLEARKAIEDGAKEIDTVINLTDVKNGDFDAVENELAAIREATKGYILKVIIETCYLTEAEKIKMCEIVTKVGADYIKTSTGFGTAGAVLEDITLFKEHIGPDVKIKAAGGIRTVEDAEKMMEAGADRIGSSAVAPILGKELC